jgi:hypothetical protein
MILQLALMEIESWRYREAFEQWTEIKAGLSLCFERLNMSVKWERSEDECFGRTCFVQPGSIKGS